MATVHFFNMSFKSFTTLPTICEPHKGHDVTSAELGSCALSIQCAVTLNEESVDCEVVQVSAVRLMDCTVARTDFDASLAALYNSGNRVAWK